MESNKKQSKLKLHAFYQKTYGPWTYENYKQLDRKQ